MFPILLKVGPLTLHTYGLLVAAGFLAAYALSKQEFKRRGFSQELLDRLVMTLMISAILGARIFYVGLEGFSEFKSDPLSFFRIWEGGLVFYGGFLAALMSLIVVVRMRRLSLLTFMDVFSGPLLLSQTIGRLGCFSAGCCYGRPTDVPWGVVFRDSHSLAPVGIPLHPTQLYEAGAVFLLLIGWLLLRRFSLRPGVLSIYYLFGYGLVRFLVEFLRQDDRGPFVDGLSPSQWISVGALLLGCGVSLYVRKKRNS